MINFTKSSENDYIAILTKLYYLNIVIIHYVLLIILVILKTYTFIYSFHVPQDSKNKYQSRASAQTRSLGLLPVLPGRQDSPLHGLLASQAVCLSCGHHCPVKYDLFDSLTLTLPQIPCWVSEYICNVNDLYNLYT